MTNAPASPPERRWLVTFTLFLGLLAFALAAVGLYGGDAFRAAAVRPPADRFAAWARLLFSAAALLGLNEPENAPTNVFFSGARVAAVAFALTAATAVVLSLSNALRLAAARLWTVSLSRVRERWAHAVVIGPGAIGAQLARDLKTSGRRRVLVLASRADDAHADEARRAGAVVLVGDARAPGARDLAALGRARDVFVTAGDDLFNLDVAGAILRDVTPPYRLVRQPGRAKLACYVHLGAPRLAGLFAAHDRFQSGADAVEFRTFNLRDTAARELLFGTDALREARDADGAGSRQARARGLARDGYRPGTDEVAHYVLFGFGEMGQTVALHAARLAHFANRRRLRLTVVDDFGPGGRMTAAMRSFLGRHPGFCPEPNTLSLDPDDPRSAWHADAERDAWTSRVARPRGAWCVAGADAVEYAVNAEFVDLHPDVAAPEPTEQLVRRLAAGQRPAVRGALVVCFDDERTNFHVATRLREVLRPIVADGRVAGPLPIYAYLPSRDGLATLLTPTAVDDPDVPLHTFGAVEHGATYAEVATPTIADLAEHFERAYDTLTGGRGGGARPHAARVRSAFRQSNVDAAAHALLKLDAVGHRLRARGAVPPPGDTAPSLTPAELDLLEQMEHNRYVAERLVDGWRHGPRSDTAKRRPSLVPWERLPTDERVKDARQIEVLHTAYHEAGFVVERAAL